MRVEVKEIHVEFAVKQSSASPSVVHERAEVGKAHLALLQPLAQVHKGTAELEGVGDDEELRIGVASHQASDVRDSWSEGGDGLGLACTIIALENLINASTGRD